MNLFHSEVTAADSMTRPKLKLLPVIIGILFAVVAAIILLVALQSRGTNARLKYLPDGSFIRIISVNYTTNFSYSVPTPKDWQRKLAEILPSSFGSRFPWWLGNSASMGVGGTPNATNLVIVTATEQKTSRQRRGNIDQRLVVFDDQGNESSMVLGGATLGNDNGKRSRNIKGWTVPTFPRRRPTLGLRFLQKNRTNDNWRAVAEFHIANPSFQNYPTWTAEPLPATKTNGDLAVALTSLTSGLKLTSDDPEIQNELGELPAIRTVFHSAQISGTGQMWSPKSVEISDATGNKWTPYATLGDIKHVGDTDEFTCPGTLWPGEAAWKLRVEFSRADEQFSPDELWTVRGITVPTAKQVFYLSNSTNLNGCKLSLVAITGTKAKQPGDMEWLAEPGRASISIRMAPKPDDLRISLVEVRDDQDRHVKVKPAPDWNQGKNVFGLTIPAASKTLDCTFALRKSRFIEFLARPEFASPHSEAIHKGRIFLANLFEPDLQLLPEYRGANVYWLYHDNYLAAKVLDNSYPKIARSIRAAIHREGVHKSGKIEIIFGEVENPLPFHQYELLDIRKDSNRVIRTEVVSDRKLDGWKNYADLLLLASIAEAGKPEARNYWDTALRMWDGNGFLDAAAKDDGPYSTYKLGLALLAASHLSPSPTPPLGLLDKLLSLQNESGGWVTGYDAAGKKIGLANVETTCLVILGLEAFDMQRNTSPP